MSTTKSTRAGKGEIVNDTPAETPTCRNKNMCSIHANSARDALAKLCTLPLLAGRNIDSSFVLPTVAGCIDIVVHCEIDRHGRRRVTEIIAPSGQLAGAMIEASPLFLAHKGALEPTGGYPTKLAKFRAAGLDPAVVLRQGSA